MKTITTINPATNKAIKSYNLYSNQKINEIIAKADASYSSYRKTDFEYRKKHMLKTAQVLQDRKNDLARTMTEEMGKTLKSSVAEVEKCIWLCEYYADKSEQFLTEEIVKTEATISKIVYQPLGVILAVMPWNYPLWQVFRFAVPSLMAGNVCLLKHASNVPECALLIEEIFIAAGFPQDAFQTLLIESSQVTTLLKDKRIKAATLTGSEKAGASVAATCGEQIKKTVLELGGSDAYIILEDADLELAASQCVISRLMNAGQSCIGAKRFIAVERVYDEFLKRVIDLMQKATYGDPMTDVDLGPMARPDLRDEVHQQVLDSIANGARVILGGDIPKDLGAYYPPTILTNVKSGQPAYDEEIFGPVASVIKAKDKADAIRIANDTPFGLGVCIFTEDIAEGQRIAIEELEAGSCFVNQFVKSDPRLPFGGIKASGYGRELGHYGIREFVNIKTIYVK